MSNISAVAFKKLFPTVLPKCPKNPIHEISTNFSGDVVCVNCKKQIKELKEEVEYASGRAAF